MIRFNIKWHHLVLLHRENRPILTICAKLVSTHALLLAAECMATSHLFGGIKVLAEPFDLDERELNEGETRHLYGYPDEEMPQTSPYYWWFQYLKRHQGYKECCERGGEGEYAELYSDWGDVHAVDFCDWFSDHGGYLFNEPKVPNELFEILDVSQLDGLNWRNTMVVSIPISIGNKELSKKEIKRQFAMLVDARFRNKPRGRPLYESEAKYKVRGYPRLDKLAEGLAIYDMRMANPKMRLPEIGIRLALDKKFVSGQKYLTQSSKRNLDASERRILGILVSQRFAKAEYLIASSTTGIFDVGDAVKSKSAAN